MRPRTRMAQIREPSDFGPVVSLWRPARVPGPTKKKADLGGGRPRKTRLPLVKLRGCCDSHQNESLMLAFPARPPWSEVMTPNVDGELILVPGARNSGELVTWSI